MDTINLEPEQPILDARFLDNLIQMWISDCHQRLDKRRINDSIDTTTTDVYADKIQHFRLWWQAKGLTLNWQLTEQTMIQFTYYLPTVKTAQGNPLSYNTKKDVHRRLGQMFKWAYKWRIVSYDYSLWIPDPNGSTPLRKAVPIDYLRRLKDACYQTEKPVQSLAILAILVGTGMRRTECAFLNIEDIEFDADNSGTISVHHAKRVRDREVQGRIVVFDKFAGKYIRMHVEGRGDMTTGPLFAGRKDDHIQPDTIYKTIKHLRHLAGLDGKFQGPHDLRRRFITTFRQKRRGESNDHLLRKQTGQSSSQTVSLYDLQDVDDLREVFISPFELMETQP